ncbi:LacI family DNA-binding transcriptional regulator [Gluconobacter cerinus]|uniref:LacI family DNA-binding transcriptional regulator n=1 Tax=Gluconobacter cerinus TaxID=38307 RepID=UPI001B8B47B9|nr:LacI family DNA-binding transcriptional regulator [Gluconobacter cerinus]MBS1026506.1 LacI family DNA-binding transcriptional regulator [Gluconobacter cerinus]MBS1045654.1 LacI family DNA-binding transcriptional regulator [Gluconobacter cerinus]
MKKSPAPQPVNLLDVARAAGVSRATASLVVRGSPLIAPPTRERVLEAMKQLGYIYNRGAANLRQSRTHTIGLLLSNIANPFFSELTAGVDDVNDANDVVCFIANSVESPERQARQIQRLREHNVDGVIICPAIGSDDTLLEDLQRLSLPYVQVLRHVPYGSGDYVAADYASGIEKAVKHLVETGRQKIMFVGGMSVHSAAVARLDGFHRAMALHQLPDDMVVAGKWGNIYDEAELDRFLLGSNAPDSAICYNDIMALALMSHLQRRGYTLGNDFAVIGMDDLPQAAAAYPPLTTIATNPRMIGQAAATLLQKRLEAPDRPTERIILPANLVIRASSETRTS